ncbi:hypothetical protein EVAR_101785_1 [Eumeta japonica]|uniref:Uncharacterized protein n=1 Tax=Eumeta variegata TaxID=151549 RepID=A0A4C1SMH9_EUMVA|nr:hypothetical protein EVAR_101785_1 [Eumeta japonica]
MDISTPAGASTNCRGRGKRRQTLPTSFHILSREYAILRVTLTQTAVREMSTPHSTRDRLRTKMLHIFAKSTDQFGRILRGRRIFETLDIACGLEEKVDIEVSQLRGASSTLDEAGLAPYKVRWDDLA